MFLKKTLIKVLNLKELDKGNIVFVNLMLKVDKQNLQKLQDIGYNPIVVLSTLAYRYPKKYPGDNLLYFIILSQDFLKGRVFNQSRFLAYCMIKRQVYGLELSGEEKELYESTFPKDEEENKEVSEHSVQKIIAFTSTAPRIGKTTTVEKLVDYFEDEGFDVEPITIAKYIRSSLKVLAELLDKDSTRFFENYEDKDLVKTFGNESVPFKTRDLLCDFSLMMQQYYGVGIWGETARDAILASSANLVFIDDLRREDELVVLKKAFGDNLIVISLDKEDVDTVSINKELSTAAQAFESKIKKESIDHYFVFNKDWSNTDSLISLIKDVL